MKKSLLSASISAMIILLSAGANAQSIYTVAGGSTFGIRDGGPATAANLALPTGVAVDRTGNIYIADHGNNRIRMVNTAGIISTVAGNGTTGGTGDGFPATAAELNTPAGVDVDTAGNIYIADESNNVIRKVNPAGIITTIAGNGTTGYTGDGGPATAAGLYLPYSVSADGLGNVYIADQDHSAIRKVNAAGIISTVAGTGTAGYSGDGMAATAATISFPVGVKADKHGNIYIVDAGNQVIRKVNPSGIISTFAGGGTGSGLGDGGPAVDATLSFPAGVTDDSLGNVYISDSYNDRIRKVNTSGIISTIAGTGTPGYTGDGGPAIDAELNHPFGPAVDDSGNVYIADGNNNVIRKINYSNISLNAAALSPAISALRITPNPNNGQCTLQGAIASIQDTRVAIDVIDISGQVVYRTSAISRSGVFRADLTMNPDLPQGLYQVRCSAGNSTVTAHFIKE